MEQLKFAWGVLKKSLKKFGEDSIPAKAAALSYYTVFSLPPMLLVVLWVSARLYKRGVVETYIYQEIGSLVGQGAARQIHGTVEQLALVEPSVLAAIAGIGGIVFTATTVFVTMQTALNRIFKVKPKAKKGIKLLKLLKDRLLSFALILTFAFILLISLAVDAFISAFQENLQLYIGQFSTILAVVLSFLFPLLIISLLFMLIYRVLPDARIRWRHCFMGGMITALLFELGKYLIGFYIGQSNLSDWYEAAGSLMILMVWVYYASIIFFFGAALTYSIAMEENGHVPSQDYATKVDEIEVEKGQTSEGI